MGTRDRDDIERSFEGQAVLQQLLLASGSLADADDVHGAFVKAVEDNVPAPVVIQALWEDEPRFDTPAQAARLFGNLLGLYELVASGARVDLGQKVERIKREKARRPAPFGEGGPDEAFVEAAWRFFDDAPKERQRLAHAFDNRQDALVSWLDEAGLDDDAFALARHVVSELFAMLELGGAKVATVDVGRLPKKPAVDALPAALASWVDDRVQEAEDDEVLDAKAGAAVRAVASRAGAGLWAAVVA